jgi:hypothetical protein
MGRFTVIATDAFDALQVDAGVLLTNFDPTNPYVTPASEDILATTTGGINPTCVPTYSDYGEDVDNVPNNMMEFKHLDGWEAKMAFSSIKFNAANTKWALGAADTELLANGVTKVKPRRSVTLDDYHDLWWVGDKANGGAYAIKLLNALSTGGLNIQSTKNGKGTNSIEVTGHVSIDAQDVMPMEIYDIPPEDAPVYPDLTLDRANVTLEEGEKVQLTAKTTPAGQTVTWSSSADGKASVSNGEITGVEAGSAVITASMTYDGTTYTDTCNVTVTEPAGA